MNKFPKIFLSGSMTGLTFEQSMKWRYKFKDNMLNDDIKCNIIMPPEFYMPTNNEDTEREAMKFEVYHLRTSDIVVADFRDNPYSIGTAMEIMLANELHIPVIGIANDVESLHPWVRECCMKIVNSVGSASSYVKEFILNG